MTQKETGVNLLWTGGWDSTFRLLELVLTYQRRVQPYYLITTWRQSSLRELEAMAKIRREIERSSPGAGELIARSVIVAEHDLPPDPEIEGKVKRLQEQAHLGPQYGWLARLAQQQGVTGLELSIHVDDKAAHFLEGHVKAVDDETERGTWELMDEARSTELKLFEDFRFPLLPLSKVDMQGRSPVSI